MSSLFDYDVFLSFASTDMAGAKDVWQTLSQGGLRVFWSTDTLKQAVGQSFVSAIQESLVRSQHFVLYWTAQAKASNWVEAEYQTFYSECYLKDKRSRRLIILSDGREPISSLPPLLRSLQITGSAQEVVALLGGIDPGKLQQENRELRLQMDRLREEIAALQARSGNLDRQKESEVERLKTQLSEVRNELAVAKRALEERPSSPPTSEAPTPVAGPAPVPVDEDTLRSLETALAEIKVQLSGALVTETGALQVWKSLYAQQRQGAIRSLLAYLERPQPDWKEQWKVIALLTYASRTPEGRELAREIFLAVADLILAGGYGEFVGKAALALIAGAPAPPRVKWEILLPHLETAPIDVKSGDLLVRVSEFTPPQERDRTAEIVADILMYTNESVLISHAISALKVLNGRRVMPRLRDVVAEAPVDKANYLAGLLAYFGDRGSIPAIRQAIENWRHGSRSIRALISSLQTLADPEFHPYVAGVLVDSHPQIQKEILSGFLPRSHDLSVIAAVTRLAESTPDPAVKELAEKYLASQS